MKTCANMMPAQPAEADTDDGSDSAGDVQTQLIAVLPEPVGASETASLQIGLGDAPAVGSASQLVLRLSATTGTVSPQEIALNLGPGQPPSSGEAFFQPTGQTGRVRFRIEAIQILGVDEVHQAGGMFLDTSMDSAHGDLRAWYGTLTLKS